MKNGEITVPFIDLSYSHSELRQEIESCLLDSFQSNNYVLGPQLEKFEREYAAFSESKYSLGVGNGYDALVIALRVAGIGPGDRVIVPSMTFVATALAVTSIGAVPVFADCNEHSPLLDVSGLELVARGDEKAVIPVHLYGYPCAMDDIQEWSAARDMVVIEDNAQAQGAKWKNKATGSWGHINATSFYPGKNLGALGDGGAITTDSEILFEKASILRNYGAKVKYSHTELGINSRLDELQAGVLSLKLSRLSKWNVERRAIAARYESELRAIAGLKLIGPPAEAELVFHLYVVRVPDRIALQTYLTANGVQTLIHYPIPLHKQECFSEFSVNASDLLHSEDWADNCLSLPIYPGLSIEAQGRVTSLIQNFYS